MLFYGLYFKTLISTFLIPKFSDSLAEQCSTNVALEIKAFPLTVFGKITSNYFIVTFALNSTYFTLAVI